MIEINNLSFAYNNGHQIFKNLDLKIQKGNIYGLLGKNGAGKTTLLKILCGLLFPNSGECTVLGHKTFVKEPDFLKDVYFLQENIYLPDVSIKEYEYVYSPFYPKYNGQDFRNYLKELEIGFDSRLKTLSHGQRKKFLIAFSLATNCSLYFMDEPTNGLDIPSKSQFRKTIASAMTEDKTFIISTHQVRDMENLIDPIIILENGQIIFNEATDTESRSDLETLFNNVLRKYYGGN